MRVELYSDRYLLDVVKLVETFHKEALSEYDEMFNNETIINAIQANKDSGTAFLLVDDNGCHGILFGLKTKSLINNKDIFQEIIWYVNASYRKYGVKLLREAEKLLKSQGFSIMIMAVLENSKTNKLKKFYEKLGFKSMETHYIRDLRDL